MQVSSLPFSEIPHQSKLFIDYQADPTSLSRYYPNAVGSIERLRDFVPTVLANYKTSRIRLCDSLTVYNRHIGAGDTTLKNIELLRDTQTVAIVTGQQAGLFTGPLYTIYKALSAVKAARHLSEIGITAVPIFWIATEDHDFDEVAVAEFVGRSGRNFGTTYVPASYQRESQVGTVEVDANIESLIERIFDQLPETEFSGMSREKIADCWHAGTTFGEAFGRTLMSLLQQFGVIVIDPMQVEVKGLSAPIYEAAIQNVDALVSGVIEKSDQLSRDNYHAQVLIKRDYFPLFWQHDDGRRVALRKFGEGIFGNREIKSEFTLADLQRIAIEAPARFSPGVMLRPVVQDYLLPTACYVGGAAEIAYFAQNSAAYAVLNRPVTPIVHRQSFTVVEPRQRRILDKQELSLPQLFDGRDSSFVRLSEKNAPAETSRLFAVVEERVNTELNRLDQNLATIDPTLAANLATRRRKIIYHIAAMRKKTFLAVARKNSTLEQQLDDLFSTILPNNNLQERSINVFSFLNKYGSNFIDWIYDSIDLDDKGHRIIDL